MTTSELTRRAESAIQRATEAGMEHARLTGLEMDLEADRPAQKVEAIRRIMLGDNPLTGRAHSASSAEAVVETDEDYRGYLRAQTACVQAKNEAFTRARSAQLLAELAIAAMKLEAGQPAEVAS